MQFFITNVKSFSDKEKLFFLKKNFSHQELQDILDQLFLLDPKQESELSLFDCCGTGGDNSNTFNISTATAILAAATGIKTCKNGGRSSTSKTGSIDVLEELGINFKQNLTNKIEGLTKFGLAFHNSKAIAETLAPLKNFAREHKLSSFLSLLGPFTNPFILKAQIIGVGKKEWFETITELAKYSINKSYCKKIALIQSINKDGQIFDELSSVTKAKIRVISKESQFDFNFDPLDFGLEQLSDKLLQGGGGHKENAAILNSIINKEANSCQIETCLINLALLLCLDNDGLNETNIRELLEENYLIAKTQFDNGNCKENWLNFLNFNQTYN